MAVDLKRLVPSFELVVDGQKADPELAGSVIGIRCSDDMDRAGRFQLHLSDVDRKWTKIDKFKMGTQVEIKLGYVGQLKTVCKAEVKTLEVVLTPEGPTRLLVAGFDKGQGLSKGTLTKTYKNVKDSDLARQVAQRNGLTADVDDSQVVHEYVIQSNLSDYDFLMQRAVIAGYRFNIDDKKLTFKKPQIGQAAAAKLVWRENIGRLAVEVNTYDQVSKITSSGWAPDTMKNMKSPSKKGDELGTQGGQVTGAQLTKQMFGEIESVLTIASGEQSLLDAMAKAEFNKRGASFVMAEGRITGDPAVKAGAVIEVDKAGQRLNGEYYVTGSEHLFFVDTGYATEFRARRFAIKKQTPPPKNPGKLAAAAQQATQKAQEQAKKVEEASKFSLKAAREAQNRAGQAAEAAKNVLDRAKQALDQVKQGGGDLARATLAQAQTRIAEAKQYLTEALGKVHAAGGEISSASDDMGKRALTAAHGAAENVLQIARGACQHAFDGFDAAKAAALDAIHTKAGEGDQFSAQVKAAKNKLLAQADACMAAARPGLAMAQASIAKGKSAIEMCAAKSPDAAKSVISGLGTDLTKVQDFAKMTGKTSQDSILGAISAGSQHALDFSKYAVARAQDAIAKAKDAAKTARGKLKDRVGDKLKDAVAQARRDVDEAKQSVGNSKDRFGRYKDEFVSAVDRLDDRFSKPDLKAGYEKVHDAGGRAHGELSRTVDKSATAIDKSEQIALAQARGALGEARAAYAEAESALSEAGTHGARLAALLGSAPDPRQTLADALGHLDKAAAIGKGAVDVASETVDAHEKQVAQEAVKLTEEAVAERKRAEAALEKAKAQLRDNDEIARMLPSRPGTGDAAFGATKAAQSAAAAAQSATGTAKDAGAAALGACKAPDDEKVRASALNAIGESEKAAKKSSETVDSAQDAVNSAGRGDGAAAKQGAAQAASQQESAASASASAGAASQQSQQSAAAAAGKSETPKPDAPPDQTAKADGGAAQPQAATPAAQAAAGAGIAKAASSDPLAGARQTLGLGSAGPAADPTKIATPPAADPASIAAPTVAQADATKSGLDRTKDSVAKLVPKDTALAAKPEDDDGGDSGPAGGS